MEKSASRTTLAHGPGHAEAGVNENGLGGKSAKGKMLKKVTSQGGVAGGATGESAGAVLAEPMTSPGGGMTWAGAADIIRKNSARTRMVFRGRVELVSKNLRGRGDAFMGDPP